MKRVNRRPFPNSASVLSVVASEIDVQLCRDLGTKAVFNRSAVAALLRGDVRLSPHPIWRLPPGPVDWDADPFDDRNWRFQFNMLRWLDPLRWGAEQGESAALGMWLKYAHDWVTSNPIEAPQARQAWEDMSDGLRAIHFVTALPIVAEKSAKDLPWIMASLEDHACWLADEKNLGHSNHALHQHQGLVAIGAVLERPDLIALAATRIRQLADLSWDDDGVNSEGAVAYHHANLRWWMEALGRFERVGVDVQQLRQRLALTPIALAHATRPDGTFVTIGDTDRQSPTGVDHPACRWVVSAGSDGEAPLENVRVYRAGYIFGRSGWGELERDYNEETFFSVTFGDKKVHGHEDGGSLTYSAAGVNWLVDPGKYSYSHHTPMRRHVMSHDSHSLTYLKGERRDRSVPVRLDRQSISEQTYDFTLVDEGYARAKISRRVVYSVSGEYLVVIDVVRSPREFEARQRWQLGPNVTASVKRRVVQLTAGEARASLHCFGTATDLKIIQNVEGSCDGLVSTGWKKSAAAPVLELERSGQLVRFISILTPGHGRTAPIVERLTDFPGNDLVFRVSTGRTEEIMAITATGSAVFAPETPLGIIRSSQEEISIVPTDEGMHLNVLERQIALQAVEHARNTRWAGDDTAEAVHALESTLEKCGSVDLGVRACLADLGSGSSKLVRNDLPRPGIINWDDEPGWRPTSYKYPLSSHRRRMNTTRLSPQATMHSLDLGRLVLPFVHVPGEEPVLTVLFHGAVDRAKITLPIFQRLRSQLEIGVGHTLAIADPTLDLSTHLRLGWYYGVDSLDLPPHIAELISDVAGALGVNAVVLRGGSGGGFAALQVGSLLPESWVVVDNPQTDIRRYSPRFKQELFEAAIGMKEDPMDPLVVQRVSVMGRWSLTDRCPNVTYIVNPGDQVHEKRHAQPFFEYLSTRHWDHALEKIEVDLGPGHRGLSSEINLRIMQSVYSRLGFPVTAAEQ